MSDLFPDNLTEGQWRQIDNVVAESSVISESLTRRALALSICTMWTFDGGYNALQILDTLPPECLQLAMDLAACKGEGISWAAGVIRDQLRAPIPMSPIDAADNPEDRKFLELLDGGKGGIKQMAVIESVDPHIPPGVRLIDTKEST